MRPIAFRIAAAACVALLVGSSLFVVTGNSMEPTLPARSIVLAIPLLAWQEPRCGDIVIIDNPYEATRVIKRISGRPGDCIDPFGKILTPVDASPQTCVILRDDEYFVMGDNWRRSTDSRKYGPVHRAHISARVMLKLWPYT